MELFIGWLVGSVMVGFLATSMKRPFISWALISAILSPLLGLVVLLVMGTDKATPAP